MPFSLRNDLRADSTPRLASGTDPTRDRYAIDVLGPHPSVGALVGDLGIEPRTFSV
jgi:hypothetical protein